MITCVADLSYSASVFPFCASSVASSPKSILRESGAVGAVMGTEAVGVDVPRAGASLKLSAQIVCEVALEIIFWFPAAGLSAFIRRIVSGTGREQ